MQEQALLIFMRNPVFGHVKTRLAASIGHQRALDVYRFLLEHTFSVCNRLEIDRHIWYSDHVEAKGLWTDKYFKAVQYGESLGERMSNAFRDTFKRGYKKMAIIGTDCPGLTENLLENAFQMLEQHDIVIGPTCDGGYYLLGMKSFYSQLFENISWSTESVLSETVVHCEKMNLSYFLLPVLNDIDEEKDLIHLNSAKS